MLHEKKFSHFFIEFVPRSKIVLFQIWPTSHGFHKAQMWAGSGPTLSFFTYYLTNIWFIS